MKPMRAVTLVALIASGQFFIFSLSSFVLYHVYKFSVPEWGVTITTSVFYGGLAVFFGFLYAKQK